ncbi:MAG: hypothetical protein AAF363_17285 [Bacteroidota bacterium]
MKTILKVFLLIALIGFSCGTKKENKELRAEVQRLTEENDALKQGKTSLTASIEGYKSFIDEIEKNFADIDSDQKGIASLNKELKNNKDVSEKIKARLQNIKMLMENSRLKILTLDGSLKKLRIDNKGKSEELLELDEEVKRLISQILHKDEEIEKLGDQYNILENLYELEQAHSKELESILNRAHYVIASTKELKNMGVIEKEGGFIGLGRVKVINADAPAELFKQIRKDETKEIIIQAKKHELISSHPEASYEIKKDGESFEKLIIKDADAFWRKGNYLIIATQN